MGKSLPIFPYLGGRGQQGGVIMRGRQSMSQVRAGVEGGEVDKGGFVLSRLGTTGKDVKAKEQHRVLNVFCEKNPGNLLT
jgi:hypothetical protein